MSQREMSADKGLKSMTKHSSDSAQAAFSFDTQVEHKEEQVKSEVKTDESKQVVEIKPQIPIPDYVLLNLIDRIRDGNTKLWQAWSIICEAPEGDIKEARIRKWDEARDRLDILCSRVRMTYPAVCPYAIEKPKYLCLECTMRSFHPSRCPCWGRDTQ